MKEKKRRMIVLVLGAIIFCFPYSKSPKVEFECSPETSKIHGCVSRASDVCGNRGFSIFLNGNETSKTISDVEKDLTSVDRLVIGCR